MADKKIKVKKRRKGYRGERTGVKPTEERFDSGSLNPVQKKLSPECLYLIDKTIRTNAGPVD